MAAAASSSSLMAASALADMLRSIHHHTRMPKAQAAMAIHQKPSLLNCMAAKAFSGESRGVMPSDPPV